MILDKRIGRDLKANMLRNTAMTLIIALSMALVVAMCSSTDCIVDTIHEEWSRCNVEDGSFETYIPLSRRNFNELEKINVSIEKMFYFDIDAGDELTLRMFANRSKIDIPYAESGTLPKSNGELFLDKTYARTNSISVGDKIYIKDRAFTVCGIGCLPDYSYVKRNVSDVASDEKFSVAVVTATEWNRLHGTNRTAYNYAYRLGYGCSADDLREKLLHLKYDKTAVTDTYIKGRINRENALRDNFVSATDGLKGGTLALSRELEKLGSELEDMGIGSGADRLAEGADSVYAGIDRVQKEFSQYLGGSSDVGTVNLSAFSEREHNSRITDAIDDSKISKQSALIAGIFLLILLVYMLSVFAGEAIERERAVIGTLYALGFRRSEILSHYIKIPVIVAAAGAVIGTVAGFMLTDSIAASYVAMYSFPQIKHIYPAYLIAYSLGLPTLFSLVVSRLILSKKLAEPPLRMMYGNAERRRGFEPKLSAKMSFEKKFRIRQFFRELSGNVTLFFGLMTAVLLIMFSVSCYGSITKYINGITDDVRCEYTYILRNPVSDLPKGACVGYTRGFYTDFPITGGEMEVSLAGIDTDNPYFPFAAYMTKDSDKIYMSDSARIKFGYKVGDRVILRDNAENKLYAFEIAGEVKYGSGLYFFMNVDAMRKAFGEPYFDEENLKKGERRPKTEAYYYNTVYSEKKLKFGHNMMLSEICKSDMKRGAEKFITLMWDMIVMLIAVSVIIFMAVMYLLMKFEIDRSSFSISLMKALGYSEKTVNSFYIGNSFFVTLAVIVLGMPVCKKIVDFAYPYCVSNVNSGFKAVLSPVQYGIIIVIVLVTYAAVRCMLVKYLRKISVAEVLKSRE